MTMKLAVSAGALCLLLGTIAPAYAQQHQEKKSEPQAGRQEQHQPQAKKPAPHPAAPARTYGGSYHGGVQSNGPVHGGVHHSGVPQRKEQVHSGFMQSRAAAWDRDHHTWQQRGGYNGYRIPEDRFRLYFGRDHFFRISGLPLRFVGGYPRFLYDGYWVMFVDPWPEAWPATWYETDDVYIEYVGDGYYLFDRAHPGIAIAVTISL
ncbi:MAG: hypothetical protein ABSD88_13015 [Candidatus Korobacteraceae bacterium]